jgi:hypothetical protein
MLGEIAAPLLETSQSLFKDEFGTQTLPELSMARFWPAVKQAP